MSNLPGVRFDITGASGSQGLLSPKSGWRAYILPRGGTAAQDSTGTLITFDSSDVASRFAANNWIQVGLTTANIRQVSAVGGDSLSVSGANVTVTENDRVFLIGNTQPTVAGGSATYTTPDTIVRQRDDSTATLYTNSQIISDANGLVQFFSDPTVYDSIIQDGNQNNQGFIINLPVGAEGISTDLHSVFGGTVTINAAFGITGVATFGETVTMNANMGVTGTAVFGSTVTINAELVVGGTVSITGGFTGTAIIPRLGEASTPTAGGAMRIVDDNVFPMTVAGVQAALDEVSAAGGGAVWVPANAGITLSTTPVDIPNRCGLIGMGTPFDSPGTFIGDASTNVTAAVRNETRDGTQQTAFVENISVDGNSATGATVGIGIQLERVFDGSFIHNVRANDCSGTGIVLSGGTGGTIGMGPLTVKNIAAWNNGDIGIHITGGNVQILLSSMAVNRNGTAQILVDRTGSAAQNGIIMEKVFMETTDSALPAMDIISASNLKVDHLVQTGATLATIRIRGVTAGSNGALASSGQVYSNIFSAVGVIVSDIANGVTVTNAGGSFLPLYMSPIATGDTGSTGVNVQQVVGMQTARTGIAIASGTTIEPKDGNFFEITGTSQIQTITADAMYSGKMVTLWFTNAAPGGISQGNNILLAGGVSFSAAQNDAITFACTGATWVETNPR